MLANTRPNKWTAHTIYGAFRAVWETIRMLKNFFSGQLTPVALAPYEKSVGYCTSPPALPSVGPASPASPALPRPTRLVLLPAWLACHTLRCLTCLTPLVSLGHQKITTWVLAHAGAAAGTLYQIGVCLFPLALRAQRGRCGGHDRTGGTQLLGHGSLLFYIGLLRQFARLFHDLIHYLLLQFFALIEAPLPLCIRQITNCSFPERRQGMLGGLPLKRRHCQRNKSLNSRYDRTLPPPLTKLVQGDAPNILDGTIMAQLTLCLQVCPASHKTRFEWPLLWRRKFSR